MKQSHTLSFMNSRFLAETSNFPNDKIFSHFVVLSAYRFTAMVGNNTEVNDLFHFIINILQM